MPVILGVQEFTATVSRSGKRVSPPAVRRVYTEAARRMQGSFRRQAKTGPGARLCAENRSLSPGDIFCRKGERDARSASSRSRARSTGSCGPREGGKAVLQDSASPRGALRNFRIMRLTGAGGASSLRGVGSAKSQHDPVMSVGRPTRLPEAPHEAKVDRHIGNTAEQDGFDVTKSIGLILVCGARAAGTR